MFMPVWLIFFASGTLMAVLTVAWCIKNRQFEDQDRARYLPFADLTQEEIAHKPPIRHGAGFVSVIVLLALGLGSVLLCAAYAWKFAG